MLCSVKARNSECPLGKSDPGVYHVAAFTSELGSRNSDGKTSSQPPSIATTVCVRKTKASNRRQLNANNNESLTEVVSSFWRQLYKRQIARKKCNI